MDNSEACFIWVLPLGNLFFFKKKNLWVVNLIHQINIQKFAQRQRGRHGRSVKNITEMLKRFYL
jgi:hypothetical protein